MLNRVTGILLLTAGAVLAQTSVDLPQHPFALMEAMQITLERHPAIQIELRQVDISRGALRVASGQFDTQIQYDLSQSRTNSPLTQLQRGQYAQLGLDVSNQSSNLTTAEFNAQQLFRSGITASPVIQTNRDTDNLANHLGLNQSKIAFQVVIPLLRGRGRDVVAAQENAARINLHAALYDASHTVAQTLGNAAIQYWSAIGAARNLEIARNSESRGNNYTDDVRTLIEADRVPRAELNQLQANVANRTAQRIAAEQQVLAAQQALALAMGLGADEVKQMAIPTDELPDWPHDSPPSITPQLVDQFVGEALRRRADLLAVRDRQHSAEILVPAARNQLKPVVNLTVNSGYAGLWEGRNFAKIAGSAFYKVKGPDAYAQITYRFPVQNNVAAGQLIQAEASYQQAALQQSDLARQISSNVITAMTSLSNNVARLKMAREAVRYYQLALDGENEKFRRGFGSLVDVLTMEDRLTGALSQQLAAQVDFATAIENLRFSTGTFLNPDEQTHVLERGTFVTPPFDWEK